MGSVRERTQQEIMDYIRQHSQNGKLTRSMLDIAQQVGYSNATIHRALRALQSQGIIEIETPERPTEPNTIVFKGEMDEMDELLSRGAQLTEHMVQLMKDFDSFVKETQRVLKRVENNQEKLQAVRDGIVNVADLPDSDYKVISIRKEDAALLGM